MNNAHSRKFQDLTGRKYGRWTVVSLAIRAKDGGGVSRWMLRCECGTEKVLPAHTFKKGDSGSCGCLKREIDLGGRSRPWRKKYESREEQKAAYAVRYADANRIAAQRRRDENPMASRLSVQKSRAKRAGVVSSLTEPEWRARLDEFNGRCAYCLKPADEMDHFRPLEAGGEHTIDNVVPCCASCNPKKGPRLIFDWARRVV